MLRDVSESIRKERSIVKAEESMRAQEDIKTSQTMILGFWTKFSHLFEGTGAQMTYR